MAYYVISIKCNVTIELKKYFTFLKCHCKVKQNGLIKLKTEVCVYYFLIFTAFALVLIWAMFTHAAVTVKN